MITLTLASGVGVEGSTLALDLSIASTGGDLCTNVQFTLSFSPADLILSSAVAGAAAVTAGKTLSSAGNLIVIWGLNTTAIADGVLATLTFLVANPPTSGTLVVQVLSVVASDADANPLSTLGLPGTITVNIPQLLCPVGGGSAAKNSPYSAQLIASGGTGPYTFNIVS